jgi:hypothetical protein
MPKLFKHPIVFLSVDTPQRVPKDIILVNPQDGSPQSFIARNARGKVRFWRKAAGHTQGSSRD